MSKIIVKVIPDLWYIGRWSECHHNIFLVRICLPMSFSTRPLSLAWAQLVVFVRFERKSVNVFFFTILIKKQAWYTVVAIHLCKIVTFCQPPTNLLLTNILNSTIFFFVIFPRGNLIGLNILRPNWRYNEIKYNIESFDLL